MSFEKSKELHWDRVRIFLQLARDGTLSAAARSLRLVPSSVARHIEELEHGLATRLFDRTPRGYVLTAAGQALVPAAKAAERAMHELTRLGTGRDAVVSGPVRLATIENFATHLILPHLPKLTANHPGIRLELVTDIRTANLSRREADLALRLIKPTSGSYVVSRVGDMDVALYASPSYVPAAGGAMDLIVWDDRQSDLPTAAWLRSVAPGGTSALSTTSLATQLAATKAGCGVAAIPCFMAKDLKRVGQEILRQPIWLILHRDSYRSAPIAAVSAFLRQCMADAQDLSLVS